MGVIGARVSAVQLDRPDVLWPSTIKRERACNGGDGAALDELDAQIVEAFGEVAQSINEVQVAAGEQHLEGRPLLKVGDRAPDFVLPGSDGTTALHDVLVNGPAVLLFLRGDW